MSEEDLRLKILKIVQGREINVGNDIGQLTKEIASAAIEHFRLTHSRALACHCECLGMNAENMWAAIANQDPVYKSIHYYQIMQKWELMNEKGEPLI